MGLLLCNTVAGLSQQNTTQQLHFINNQVQEQKTWQLKQLPKNSVLYQMAFKVPDHHIISKPAPAPVYYHQPVQNYELNSLQHFIQQDRNQYLQSLKNSWWKDPSKGIGAGILHGIVNEHNQVRKL